jgi:hypothetical protein
MVVDVVAKVFFALEKSCQCSFSRLNFKSDYESDPLSPPKGISANFSSEYLYVERKNRRMGRGNGE